MRIDLIKEDGTEFVYYTGDLDQNKQEALDKVTEWFQREMENGKFTSPSLNVEVDNRRYGYFNDKDNVQSLIDKNVFPVSFKASDNNFYSLSLSQLQTLKQEMIDDGLYKYQKKWTHEQYINSCTNIEDIWNYIDQENI